MTEFSEDDILKLNANSEQIGYRLADIVRSILRSSISASENYSQEYRAAENLISLIKTVHLAEKLNFHKIIDVAVSDLSVAENDWEKRSVEDKYIALAKIGTKYLIEKSCDDNAAEGRASKSMMSFIRKIERLEAEIEALHNRSN